METLQVTRIDSAESLAALNRSEIDIQISTAKQYPRDVHQSLERVVSLATVNPTTAAECFYSLRRGSGDNGAVIEGPSVRLAEIVATSWGNLRVASQIIGNDGKFITARGVCHDLETNVAIARDVRRRITDSKGRTFSDDMQVVTGNAAGAIAFRNAVFAVVPKAVISGAIAAIKSAITSNVEEDFEASKNKMFTWFAKLGVTKDMILSYFELESESDLTPEDVAELRTTATAIREKQATAKELFIDSYNEKKRQSEGEKKAKSAADKVAEAMAKQTKAADPIVEDMPMFE